MTMPDVNPVPEDGPLIVSGQQLPIGHQISALTTSGRRPVGGPYERKPVLWATDEQLSNPGQEWWTLRDAPLFPVLLDSLHSVTRFGNRRPWDADDGLVVWSPTIPDEGQIGDILAAAFWKPVSDDSPSAEFHAPFRTFPGLATASSIDLPLDALQSAVYGQGPAWLGLVPAGRNADIPLSIGWFFTSDAFTLGSWGTSDPPGAMTTLLRTWESRFGTQILRLGFASLTLLVRRPPLTMDHALNVAAELSGICSEFHAQESATALNLREIAEQIQGAAIWNLWWD